MQNTKNKESCNWVFNQCSISNLWRGSKREHVNEIFNDYSSPNVIKSTKLPTLIEAINKTDGNIAEMNKMFKDDR